MTDFPAKHTERARQPRWVCPVHGPVADGEVTFGRYSRSFYHDMRHSGGCDKPVDVYEGAMTDVSRRARPEGSE